MRPTYVIRCLIAVAIVFFFAGCSGSMQYSLPGEVDGNTKDKLAESGFLQNFTELARKNSTEYYEGIPVNTVKESIGYVVSQGKDPRILFHKGHEWGVTTIYGMERPYNPKKDKCRLAKGKTAEDYSIVEFHYIRALESDQPSLVEKTPNGIEVGVESATILVKNELLREFRDHLNDHTPPLSPEERITNASILLAEAISGNSNVASACKTKSKVAEKLSDEIDMSIKKHHACKVAEWRYKKVGYAIGRPTTSEDVKGTVRICAEDGAYAAVPELQR